MLGSENQEKFREFFEENQRVMERAENPWLIEEERKEENMGIQQIFEEEEEEEEEQSNGVLKVRERRKRENGGGVVIRETNGGSFEKEEKKVEEEEEEERSFCFDSEKGSNFQNGAKKDLTNGAEFLKIILPQLINKTENLPTQNGSNPNPNSNPEILNKTEILPTQNTSNPNFTNPNSNLTNSNLNYDLEKVLEEQETHDLFCPNCNSCITKRVILKKRKRIIRDIKSEFHPDKIPNFGVNNDNLNEPLLNNNNNQEEEEEEEEREQHILFKCLSCFTFFIPKECGINMFDICGGNKERIQNSHIIKEEIQIQNNLNNTQTKEEGKTVINREIKEEGQNVIFTESKGEGKHVISTESKGEIIKSAIKSQNSNQISSNNWFLDLFQPGRNKNKLINESDNIEDPSFSYWQNKNKPSDENQIKNTKNETVISVKEGKKEETLTLISNEVSSSRNTSTVTNQSETLTLTSNGASRNTTTVTSESETLTLISNEASRNTSTVTSESEIEEIESTGTNGKSNGISFTVGSVSVTTVTEEKINDVQINQVSNGGIKTKYIPSEMKSPKETLLNLKPGPVQPLQDETIIIINEQPSIRPRNCTFCPGVNNWDIVKPIVYGGLIEIITSLSVVSSASASGATTLNILLIGVAALIGGFVLILHDLMELKRAQDEANDLNENELGRYFALLGHKGHFGLHATISIISYLFFGLLPPIIYGFTFRETDDSEYKTIAVALSAIICVAILAIGKAHVRTERKYFTTIIYYVAICVASSGLAYVAGILLKRLMESLGLFGEGFSVGMFFELVRV